MVEPAGFLAGGYGPFSSAAATQRRNGLLAAHSLRFSRRQRALSACQSCRERRSRRNGPRDARASIRSSRIDGAVDRGLLAENVGGVRARWAQPIGGCGHEQGILGLVVAGFCRYRNSVVLSAGSLGR